MIGWERMWNENMKSARWKRVLKPAICFLMLILCSAQGLAQAVSQTPESRMQGKISSATLKRIFSESPENLQLTVSRLDDSKANLNLKKYSPFTSTRKVWMNGEALSKEQYGGDHIYYRGEVVGEAASYAFVILRERGESVDFFVSSEGGIVKGVWEGNEIKWQVPEKGEYQTQQRSELKRDYPDYEVPPTRTPPAPKAGKLPVAGGTTVPLRAPSTSITMDATTGWKGPYSIEVPAGANYVGAIARKGGSASVYVSTNPNPASISDEITYCAYSKCFIADPQPGTYYLSVYVFDDEQATVDFGYGTPLASDDLYLATIAVEVDDTLLADLGSAAAASDYVAQLFAYNSVLYEREVKTRLAVGDLVLITSESDPYQDTDSTKTRLDDFRNYWRSNKGGVERSLVAHLSTAISGGRAALDTLCSDTEGYSVSGVYGSVPTDQVAINWDGIVNAHELGHNFGSRHTHCYRGVEGNDQPIDGCYVDEDDKEQCFQGTTALPSSGSLTGGVSGARNGTIMSYCHLWEDESGNYGGTTNIANSLGLNHPYGIEPDRVPTLMLRKTTQVSAASSACAPKLSESGKTYITVTGTANAGGAISPSALSVVAGGNASFTVTPDAGYKISAVTGCGGTLSGSTFTTGAVTAACTVVATFVQGFPALSSGVPVPGLAGSSSGDPLDYSIDVPAASTSLSVLLNVSAGDPDLYVDTVYPPRTGGDALCISWNSRGEDEICEISNPSEGRYYVRIKPYEDFSGATLTATVAVSSAAATNFIERFYTNILGRPSDEGGLQNWLNVIQTQSAAAVALGFLNSAEFLNKNLDDRAFVDILYQTLFDREGDAGGVAVWMDQLGGGKLREMVIWGFLRSGEFKTLSDSFGVTALSAADESAYGVRAFTERFYTLVLGRQPDKAGFDGWVSALANGTYSGGDIAKAFFLSAEYLNQNTSDSAFVETCYQAFFGRAADSAGSEGWLNALAQGQSRDYVLNGFIGSAEFAALAASYGIKPSRVAASVAERADAGFAGAQRVQRISNAEAIPALPILALCIFCGLLGLLGVRRLTSR